MKIENLVSDIYEVVRNNGWYSEDISHGFVRELDQRLSENINSKSKVPSLRLSQMGKRCPCQLWHSIHSSSLQEPLPPWARIKYTYGHILEAYVISMAKQLAMKSWESKMSWYSMVSLATVTVSSMATLLMSNLLVVLAFRNSKTGVFGQAIISATLISSMATFWLVATILSSGIKSLDFYLQLINH